MSEEQLAQELKKTPLHQLHHRLGARFTSFGGWEMPVQYSGLVDEHQCVRTAAGLFDVSHMGEVLVSGLAAEAYLEWVTCNAVGQLSEGAAQYSMLLNHDGGVVDDIIVYKLASQEFLLCVNAANTEKDVQWLTSCLSEFDRKEELSVEDVSSRYAQIALQGPASQEILEKSLAVPAGSFSLEQLGSFRFCSMIAQLGDEGSSSAVALIIARTGYTGEDGFELFCAPNDAEPLAERLLTVGQPLGLKPVGLGARDTLRLEACLPLHGHEIADDITPLEARLAWVVKLDKGAFIGREALQAQKHQGVTRKLVGLEVLDRGIAREGAAVYAENECIGRVTSGTKPPSVAKVVALALLSTSHSRVDTEVEVEVRGKRLKAKVIKRPFYKRG